MADKASTSEATMDLMNDDSFDTVFAALSEGKVLDEVLAKPEEVKPEEVKPEVQKPEEVKPEAPKPEEVKAAEDKAAKAAARKAEKAEAKARAEAEKTAADEAARAAAGEAAKIDTDAATKILAEVAKDFPEVGQALEVIRKQALAEAKAAFAAELETFKQTLAPVVSTVQTSAQSAHEQAILTKHPDAFDLVDTAEEWIETQPKFLQAGYKHVLDNGSAAEIVEFFDLFKQATGRGTKADAGDTEKAAAEEAERLKKLKSQEGVRSRQTQRKDTLDPNDYDGAFEKFAESA
jgi:hypothetical protein